MKRSMNYIMWCETWSHVTWNIIIIIIIIIKYEFFLKLTNHIWYWLGMIFAPLGLWIEELLVCKHAKNLETKSFKN